MKEWNFSIYRYSTGRHGELPMACTRGEVADVVSMAMNAYNLGWPENFALISGRAKAPKS